MSAARKRLNAPWAAAAATALLVAPFLALRIARSGGDLSHFVCAGGNYCDPDAVPPGLQVFRGGDGYDGQFFYRLALDPFTLKVVDYGIRLDKPAYRQARIAYPLLAWLLSAPQPKFVPLALIAINVAGLAAIGWMAGGLARSLNRHALFGLAVSLYPGFLLTMARDTGEIVSACGLMGAIFALQRERYIAATIALSLAVLARKTNLGLAAAVGLVAAWRLAVERRWNGVAWLPAVLPVLVLATWHGVLWHNWGYPPLREAGENFGRPFEGLLLFLQRGFIPFHGEARLWAAQLGLLALVGGGASLARIRQERIVPSVRVAWCIYAVMAVSLSGAVWSEDWAFLRAGTEFYVVSAVLVLAGSTTIRTTVVSAALAVSAWTAQMHRDG